MLPLITAAAGCILAGAATIASPTTTWARTATSATANQTQEHPYTLMPALYRPGNYLANHTKPFYHHRRVGGTYYDGMLYHEVELEPTQRQLESYDIHAQRLSHRYPLTHELAIAPVVTARFIYVFTRDGKLTKFVHADPTPRWQITLSSHAIQHVKAYHSLYVVTAYGDVMKIDDHTAEIMWISALSKPAEVLYYDEEAIAIHQDKLYIGTQHTTEVFSTSGDWLGAFNTPPYPDDAPNGVVGPLSFQGNTIQFVTFRGHVYTFALDEFKSPPLQSRNIGATITAQLPAADGTYYGTLDGQLLFWPHLEAAGGAIPQTFTLSTDPIASISSLSHADLIITTTTGQIFGRSQHGATAIFATTLAAAIYAKPLLIHAPHPMLIVTSAYKNIYAYRLLRQRLAPQDTLMTASAK